jgi:hypothetical protein
VFYRPVKPAEMTTKRIVVIATLDVSATYQVGGLARQCGAVMKTECAGASIVVLDVVTKKDLTGTLPVGRRLTTGRRRIGAAITVRLPSAAMGVELQDRCERRIRKLIGVAGLAGAVTAYIADPDNSMAALPTFK